MKANDITKTAELKSDNVQYRNKTIYITIVVLFWCRALIATDWLMSSLDPLLDENQFGCRPGRSTTHTLIAVLHKWMEILDKRGSVRAVFIDYRKAFDIITIVF